MKWHFLHFLANPGTHPSGHANPVPKPAGKDLFYDPTSGIDGFSVFLMKITVFEENHCF